MSAEIEHECPECGGTQTFWLSASTRLHLGEKKKWCCADCGHELIRIDGAIDSARAAESTG
ncbi:MAG: hypothetical protein ABEI98_03575 [Halorhabdus sp.]